MKTSLPGYSSGVRFIRFGCKGKLAIPYLASATCFVTNYKLAEYL